LQYDTPFILQTLNIKSDRIPKINGIRLQRYKDQKNWVWSEYFSLLI